MGTIRRMELKTKVRMWFGKKEGPDYYCALIQEKGKEVCLEIRSDESTCGRWTWYIHSLFSGSHIDDFLYLDWGQDWFVIGIRKVYKEVIANYQIPA